MTIGSLALIVAVALAGPLLAWSDRLRVPVVVGELAAGLVVGRTGLQIVDAEQPTFVFLADVGFATVMFVAGSHIPVRDRQLARGAPTAIRRVLLVGAAAALLGPAVAAAFGTRHGALYAVLLASSSAAIVLPIVDSLGLSGPGVLQLLPQIAIADAACVVALPLVIDPARAGRAAAGSAAVLACAAAAFGLLWLAQRRGWRRAAHRKSERRGFALELRVSLLILLLLATLAQRVHVSILLAGFSLGVAVAALGEPRRLARQLFGLTEGLFGPVFFVWLGASLDLRDLGRHAAMIGLGVALAAAALLAHITTVITRQPVPLAALGCAQLGVPVAAATIGQQLHLLRPGEPAALLLAAVLTVAAASLGARRAVRPASQAQDGA